MSAKVYRARTIRKRRRVAVAPGKPPYRVPTMAEVEAVEPNGYTAVSSFSGCGGSCLGFRMAGFKVAWASEFVPAAQEVYRLNHPTHLDTRDIRKVEAGDILKVIGLEPGELDVFEGSPPCASFSTAGRREKKWGEVSKYSDTEQRADDLFFEYARILGGLQPKVFVAENVRGLTIGKAKGYFIEILAALEAEGYVVEAQVLDAQWLGVPQRRQRVIIQGVRKDLGLVPAFPKPLSYRYSLREVLPGLQIQFPRAAAIGNRTQTGDHLPVPTVGAEGMSMFASHQVRVIHDTSGNRSMGEVTDEPAPCVTVGMNGMNSSHFKVVDPACLLEGTAIGKEAKNLRPGAQSDRYFSLVRPGEDEPSPTVTQIGGHRGVAAVLHPNGARKFTIEELKRVCAFPDDFKLVGKYQSQWERLGRAVPPLMMKAVAEAIRDGVLSKCVE